jgi:hypothetical protein
MAVVDWMFLTSGDSSHCAVTLHAMFIGFSNSYPRPSELATEPDPGHRNADRMRLAQPLGRSNNGH